MNNIGAFTSVLSEVLQAKKGTCFAMMTASANCCNGNKPGKQRAHNAAHAPRLVHFSLAAVRPKCGCSTDLTHAESLVLVMDDGYKHKGYTLIVVMHLLYRADSLQLYLRFSSAI